MDDSDSRDISEVVSILAKLSDEEMNRLEEAISAYTESEE